MRLTASWLVKKKGKPTKDMILIKQAHVFCLQEHLFVPRTGNECQNANRCSRRLINVQMNWKRHDLFYSSVLHADGLHMFPLEKPGSTRKAFVRVVEKSIADEKLSAKSWSQGDSPRNPNGCSLPWTLSAVEYFRTVLWKHWLT